MLIRHPFSIGREHEETDQKEKTAAGIVAAALLGMVLSVTGFIYNRYFVKHPVVAYDKIRVEQPEITEDFLTTNPNSRPGTKLKHVKGIVIHYTANPGTGAKANRDYFESRKDQEEISSNKVSSHFVIGLKGEIVQCIPLDEIAYASNDRNSDTISIECCHSRKNGKFNRKTYHALIRLCAWLCDRYEIESPDDIIRHYDVTGKLCPLYYVKHSDKWEKLREDIWNKVLDSQYKS